jgi:ABC-2 type transport system ATP-binding protein
LARTGSDSVSNEVVLRTRGLTKRYGARLAVDHLDLEVRRREIFGFLGPNGAGKTTTIRMCLGLITPSAGGVAILGSDVAHARARVLPRVGALVEQPALYPYMSGRNNLLAVGDALGGVTGARVDTVLEMVGLLGRARDRVRTYSLGMKQRLGVALALLNDPDLLILDEPANGLDPAGIVEMRDLLRRLAAEGKTVFLSSHVLAEVRQICTRVAIVNLGRLVAESSVEELVGGHGEFVVAVDRPQQAVALLRAQPWGGRARLDGAGRIITGAPDGQSTELNLFLVRAGFTPGAITPYEQDLEDVFLRLTGSAPGATGAPQATTGQSVSAPGNTASNRTGGVR